MKKILFLVYDMNVGGVEKSLLNLLSALSSNQYEIHVGMVHKRGGFMESLPSGVIIHEIKCYSQNWRLINDPPRKVIRQLLLSVHIKDALLNLFFWIDFKLTHNRIRFFNYLLKNEPVFPESFDLAVSFAGPSQMLDYYVCKKVEAKKKCAWIHFDISKVAIDKGMIARLYKQLDKIFIVSWEGKKIFDYYFPQFSGKTEVFYNIVTQDQVLKFANIGPSYDDTFDGKRILTVGRISEEKGQRLAVLALKILIGNGINVKWVFVGDGKERGYCEKLAHDLGIEGFVSFLGTQINPYGYMKDCDVYVQPSRHEGFCITLLEASCFRMPIVATDFTGAVEQLKDRPNGIITSMQVDAIVRGILKAFEIGPLQHSIPLPIKNDLSKLKVLLQ